MKTSQLSLSSLWKEGQAAPIDFTYEGNQFADSGDRWVVSEQTAGEGKKVLTYRSGHLSVIAEVRIHQDFDAVEWVLKFRNDSTSDTSIISDVKALNWITDILSGSIDLHYAMGSEVMVSDFEGRTTPLLPGRQHKLHSLGGRSSRNNLPFFDIQTGESEGVIGAVGWTGSWQADFWRKYDGSLKVEAGMQRTHFKLHPGEEVRTPCILLMAWTGDKVAGHNLWRRLLLTHYSPFREGQVQQLPAAYEAWGADSEARQIEKVRRFPENKIPVDLFWIDAGWYGHEPFDEKANVFITTWGKNRGNWWPSPECYPNGLSPISQELKKHGIGFMLWLEIEIAQKGSDLMEAHPDWFFLTEYDETLINLGNEDALEYITNLVSSIIETAGLSWYRQDFNFDPERSWALGESPDRIGITEMRHVAGLYRFWDALRERHPHLMIDNCASGGRRIDLETMRRAVPLTRSDYQCNPDFDLNGSQWHSSGLAPWVPLSAGWCAHPNAYALRSCYSAGLVFDGGVLTDKYYPAEWLKEAIEEFHEVRPFMTGDYYPLRDFSYFDADWIVWQYHRTDLDAGVVIVLKRKYAPTDNQEVKMKALDPEARYDLDLRNTLTSSDKSQALGSELMDYTVTVTDRPGSAVLFYTKSKN